MPRFRADEHVRKREDFERIYETGRRASGRLMTMFVRENGRPGARLGIAATRKIGSAVIRNRAKRLVREVFRHHKPTGGFDVVIVPRREMLDAPYDILEAEFRALLDRRDQRRGPSSVGRVPRRTSAHQRI
ncbi:MAG: ribonuclease P protein component [Acidobacteria bacterium]|nr:ribonuclease P protein component [Acidobacteriota bacterium]